MLPCRDVRGTVETLEGLTKREIIRCLKRYIAREIYKNLPAATQRPPSADQLQHAA